MVAKSLTARPAAAPYAVRLAASAAEVRAAQALRHRVFVEERGAAADAAGGLEGDRFDAASDHLLLLDAGGAVVGAARVMGAEGAARAGGFATEEEFDLRPLRRSGLRLAEVGRICLSRPHRGGAAGPALWAGVMGRLREAGAEAAVGLASFPGADPAAHADALAVLMRDFGAEAGLAPVARAAQPPLPPAPDRRAAMLGTPALVKAYLRAGARVGRGAYPDRRFGCTDVCMVLRLPGGPG